MIEDDGYNIGRDYLVEKAVEGGRWKVCPHFSLSLSLLPSFSFPLSFFFPLPLSSLF